VWWTGGVSADGGASFALNVIPTEAMAGFDCRVPPTVPIAVSVLLSSSLRHSLTATHEATCQEFEELLKEWTKPDGLSYEFVYRTPSHEVSDVDR